MKKRFIVLVFLICAVLFGCSNEETDKKVTPGPEHTNKEMKLPDIQITDGNLSTMVFKDVWCLKVENLCSLTPNPPQEVVDSSMQPLRVQPGDVFDISISTNGIPESNHIYSPDIIELTQFKSDEEKVVEVTNHQATAPTEEGLYYYSLKLQWDGDYVGQAYYAFSVRVH